MRNLRDGGFKGAVLPIDPALHAVAGVLAYPTVADLPVAPDLAVIADPDCLAAVLPALAAKGCFAAIVLTDTVPLAAADGWPRGGPKRDGNDWTGGKPTGLAELARRTGVRVLGPGSFGLIVPGLGLNASRAHLTPAKGGSRWCRNRPRCAARCWTGPGRTASASATSSASAATPISASAWRSTGWRAIRAPAPSCWTCAASRTAGVFLSAARAASRLRPVVAIRAGGLLLDPSGTAELAFEAALRRAGVLCVVALEDLLTAAETLSRARPARGEALAIVSNAIGAGRMAADAVLRDGLQLATLSPETEAVLRMRLPARPSPRRPRRPARAARGDRARAARGDRAAQHCRRHGLCRRRRAAAAGRGRRAARRRARGGRHPRGARPDRRGGRHGDGGAGRVRRHREAAAAGRRDGRDHRRDAPPSPGRGRHDRLRHARAGGARLPASGAGPAQPRRRRASCRTAAWSRSPPTRPRCAGCSNACARPAGGTWRRTRRWTVLAAYGVPTVPCRAVGTEPDAVTAAALLGYPVVVKLRDTVPPGCRARGGLALDLHDAAEVRLAARTLTPAPDAPRAGRAGDAAGAAPGGPRARTVDPRGGRSGVRPDHRLRPGRHRGRGAARHRDGPAAAEPDAGAGADRAHPRRRHAGRLPRHAGRADRYGGGDPGAGQPVDPRLPGDRRAGDQPAVRRRRGRAGRRCLAAAAPAGRARPCWRSRPTRSNWSSTARRAASG